MTSCQEPLLKSDDEDELVFDRTGLLSNKVTVKPDVCHRGHSAGKRMQYVRTVNLCLAFFALGLCFAIPTATLNDLQATVNANLSDIEFIYTARYSGYVFGAIIGGILFDRYNRQFLLFLSLLATAVGIIVMPFCTKVGALMACTAITGITMGFLDTGGNVWCLDLWGKKSAPLMQTLHFCFGLGAFVAPLVAEPFLSPHFGNNTTGLIESSAVNATIKNVPHIWFPHQRVKAYPEHIQKENVLQHINSTGMEGIYETFPLRKSLKHLHGTSQKFTFQDADINNRKLVKRDATPYILEEKDDKILYMNNNGTSEMENGTVFANFSDYYSSNNTSVSQNLSDYFVNNTLQEDSTVAQLMVTMPPTIESNVKVKPKKPHYADGNQLKHDDKWDRVSRKQKTQNDLNKTAKLDSYETTSTTPSIKAFDALNDTNSLGNRASPNSNTTNDVPIKNNTKSQLAIAVSQYENHRNNTDEPELPISRLDNTEKSVINVSLTSTEFSFPVTETSVFDKMQDVKSNLDDESLNLHHNNVTTVNFVEGHSIISDNTAASSSNVDALFSPTTQRSGLFEKEQSSQYGSKSTISSENIHSFDHKGTEKLFPIKTQHTATLINEMIENDLQVPTLLSNTNLVSSLTDTGNKTELKQTSLRSVEIRDLTSPTLTPEEFTTENVTQKSDEKLKLISNGQQISTQANLLDNSSENSEGAKDSLFSTESSFETTNPGRKHSHMDFLSNLFAMMCQHRLGKFEIAYVILGIYIFIVASIFLICLCLNPREPRSRQEEQLDKSRNITATFKISVIILMSLFLCLYVGMEVAVGQLLQTFTVKQYLQLSESTGYFMTYSFWGSFALSRGISIALSIKFSGLCLLFVDLIICLTTSVLLVIGANKVEALLWIGIVVLAFGMAPIFPAAIAWIEHYLPISNRIASAFILGAALGEMTIPLIIQRFIYQEPMVLMYVNVIVNILCLVTFIALWFLASHQGEKYKAKVNRTMYHLANFDDVEDGYELCFSNSHWQNDYNSHILLERKLVGKTS